MKIKIFLKVLFIKIFEKYPEWISDINHSKLLYFIIFGHFPNMNSPKTMNEYICSTKISDEKLEYSKYTDKYEVRKYVKSVIGEQYLNDILGIYYSFDEINFNKLPDSFALKATHGSGYNIIVSDKNKLDINYAKKKFDIWLKENFYYKDREKNYKNIVPRIMCDKFIRPLDGELEEYKLFCFKGKVGFIQHNKEIGDKRYSNIFSPTWDILPIKYGYKGFKNDKKPKNGGELIDIAEKLSKPFNFVRVDLYNVDGKIIFSELTFHSGGGLIPFKPRDYDRLFGKLLGL